MTDVLQTRTVDQLPELAELEAEDLLLVQRGEGPAQTAPAQAMMDFMEANGVGAVAAAASAASAALSQTARAGSEAARDEAVQARADAFAAAELADGQAFFVSKAAAEAGLGGVDEGAIVVVVKDETQADARAAYRKTGGALVFVANLGFGGVVYVPDQASLTGSMALGSGLRNLAHTTGDTGQRNQTWGVGAGDALTTGRLNILIGTDTGKAMTGLDTPNTYGGVNGNAGNVWVGPFIGVVANGAYDCSMFGVQCGLNMTSPMDLVGQGINCMKNIEAAGETVGTGHAVFEFLIGAGPIGAIDSLTEDPEDPDFSWGHRMAGHGDQAGRFNADGSPKTRGKKSSYYGALTRSGANWAVHENVFGYAAVGLGSNTTIIGGPMNVLTQLTGGVKVYSPASVGSVDLDGVRVCRAGEENSYALVGYEPGGDKAVFAGRYSGGGFSRVGIGQYDGGTYREVITIGTNGKVGFNVPNPSYDFEVAGPDGFLVKSEGGGVYMLTLPQDVASRLANILPVGTKYAIMPNGGALEALTVAADGKVGVKTESPAYDLTVTGQVLIKDPGVSEVRALMGGDEAAQRFGVTVSAGHRLGVLTGGGATEALTVAADGKVGVNDDTPQATLDVGGTIAASGPVRPGSYTVATVPSAVSSGAGACIFVSDEVGGATLAFSDGAGWKRVSDLTPIAA